MILFVNDNKGILFLAGSAVVRVVREFLVKITTITRQKIMNTPTWKQ